MKKYKRELLIILISIIGATAWGIADYTERGLVLGIFGGPLLITVCVLLPTILDIIKKRRLNMEEYQRGEPFSDSELDWS